MKKTAVVDRFEGDFVILDADDSMISIPLTSAPKMLAEGMVVEYDGDTILRIDMEETERRERDMQRRFERILGKDD